MNKLLSQLRDGERTTIRVLLSSRSRGVTAKGAPYLSFVLQDKSGTMDAKYWNVPEGLLDQYQTGMIVDASGDVLSHNHQLQFRIKGLTVVEGEIDARSFAQEGPFAVDELREQVEERLAKITNHNLKLLLDAVYQRYREAFYEYPAATKNHHDFVGGLATHVLGMMKLAEAICAQYPLLNKDLLLSGVFLHDLGKLQELSGAIVPSYTNEGRLLGHISMFQAEITTLANELNIQDSEEVTLVRHMILSHHGAYEYGSPVLPMIPEAEVLHLIDNLDARMNTMEKALNATEEGAFTPRIFALENRSFYKMKMKSDD